MRGIGPFGGNEEALGLLFVSMLDDFCLSLANPNRGPSKVKSPAVLHFRVEISLTGRPDDPEWHGLSNPLLLGH